MRTVDLLAPAFLIVDTGETDSLGDIVDDNGAVGISVVHGSQRFISLLTGGVPYLELDGCALIQRYRLSQESSADCGFSIVVELVLDEPEYEGTLRAVSKGVPMHSSMMPIHTLPTADSPEACQRCLSDIARGLLTEEDELELGESAAGTRSTCWSPACHVADIVGIRCQSSQEDAQGV
jgi:hypothetical protein